MKLKISAQPRASAAGPRAVLCPHTPAWHLSPKPRARSPWVTKYSISAPLNPLFSLGKKKKSQESLASPLPAKITGGTFNKVILSSGIMKPCWQPLGAGWTLCTHPSPPKEPPLGPFVAPRVFKGRVFVPDAEMGLC